MSHPRRPSLFSRLLYSVPSKRRAYHERLRRRLLVGGELLESRALMATIIWGNASGGNWNVGSNWVGGVVPGANDDVDIPDLPGTPTITFNTGTVAVKSLSNRETFVISGGTFSATSISQVAGSFSLASGTLQNSRLATGTINVTGASTLGTNTIGPGASLVVAASTPVSIAFNTLLTVDGTVHLQSGSTLSFGSSTGSTQMVVNGTLRTNSATITGPRNLQLSDSAIVDWSDSTFSVPIVTPAKLIDSFSAAGGGKDNKSFREIYINSGTLASGSLNLRLIGTQTTQNLYYYINGPFIVAAGATLNLLPNVRAEISFNTMLTVDGTAHLQSGSTLNFGSSTGSTQMVVNGTLRTNSATITGPRNLQLSDSAIVDWSDSTFSVPIVTPAKLIDSFSAAGGGKDNRSFREIYINSGTLASGSLNLRLIGTQTTQNLYYYINGPFIVAAGATLNLLPNVRAEISFNTMLTVDGTAHLQSGSTLNFGSSTGSTQMVVNGTLRTNSATITGPRNLQLSDSAIVDWSDSTFSVPIVTPAKLIDSFSAAGGGKDNRSFREIYLNSGTLASGSLNLRLIGTQTTQNLYYYINGPFIVAAGATLNLLPNVRAEISFNTMLTVDGTAHLQSGSTLNFGSSTGSTQMVVNGTLRTNSATITGPRNLQLSDSAIVDWSDSTFNVPIVTPAKLIDSFSTAGGGKDNKSFREIYINSGTLASGSLNLRLIGTQTTQNLYYYINGPFTVAAGATLNLMPNVRLRYRSIRC